MIAMFPWAALMLAALVLPSGDSAPHPQTSVHVKFVSPPTTYSHSQRSASLGSTAVARSGGYRRRLTSSRSLVQSSASLNPIEGYPPSRTSRITRQRAALSVVPVVSNDPELMWPMGVFLPPDSQVLQLILHHDNLIGADPDPFLLTGSDAEAVVGALFGHGELFFGDYPHARALYRHQDERQVNGLSGNRLGSIRPESEFYRWPNSKPQSPVPGYY